MKTAKATLCLLAFSLSAALAQPPSPAPAGGTAPFEIKDIQRAVKRQAFVDKSWQLNVPCVEVSIRTNEDLGTSRPFVRAYFFRRDKTLAYQAKGPSQATASIPQNGMASLPEHLKPKDTYKVYFAIPSHIRQGKDQWARVVVVFGEGQRAVTDIFPADDIAPFAFDEKAFAVVKGK